MKFGIVTSFGSVHDYVAMARDAEATGWDGVFAGTTSPSTAAASSIHGSCSAPWPRSRSG